MRYARHPVNRAGWTSWIRPRRRGFRISCCSCGLVHELSFRVRDGVLQFKARRNERATAAVRRRR